MEEVRCHSLVLSSAVVLVIGASTSRMRARAAGAARHALLLTRVEWTEPQVSGPWIKAVAAAQDEAGRGRFAAAADLLRNARKVSPDMPAVFVLQLVQYLVQHVTETPSLSRAEAAKSLAEATAITDELIKRKQEVRLAMMAKAMALQTQADRVEQAEARRTSLRAEADKLSAEARFVNADGTAIPKTAADEWQDLQGGRLRRRSDSEGGRGRTREVRREASQFRAGADRARPASSNACGRDHRQVSERHRGAPPASRAGGGAVQTRRRSGNRSHGRRHRARCADRAARRRCAQSAR